MIQIRRTVFLGALLGACTTFNSPEPAFFKYSATLDVLSANPTNVRVIGSATNVGRTPAKLMFGCCPVGLRVSSVSSDRASSAYVLDPNATVSTLESYEVIVDPGKTAALGQVSAMLSGKIAPGTYRVIAVFYRKGNPEALAGVIEVH